MKRTFRLKVIVPGAPEFREGMGDGVLVEQDVEFDLSDAEYDSPRFQHTLLSLMQQLTDETVDATVEEVTDE